MSLTFFPRRRILAGALAAAAVLILASLGGGARPVLALTNCSVGDLTFDAEEQEFRAVVRHTEPDGHEFIIGVEVLSGNGDPPEPSDSTDPAVADYERDSSAAATLAAPIGSEHQNS